MIKFYKKLELDKILELLAEEVYSENCKEKILKLNPYKKIETIREEIKKTDDAFLLASKFGTPRFRRIKNVCNSIKRAQQGSTLSFREFLDVADVLRETMSLCDWHSQCENMETSLKYLFDELYPNKPLEQRISNSIISEEEMSDAASPELAMIRKRITRQGIHIREQLDKLIRNQTTQKYLQENIITMRDGRFVVPVKSEHKGEIPGLVHDSSGSGATLFIEPMSVVEANNEIRVLRNKEKEEIEHIVREMSAEIGGFAESLITDFEACIELELYFAKANFGAKMKGSTPEITEEPVVILNKARHPLIDRDAVVPISLSLGEENSCLIITGPNTGGKTVALKTVGLLTLMAMCGLMIPAADGSKIGVFSNILVDLGDEQSIEQSLSTFSSHITNIVKILEIANEKSLILLDELGSGTDPIEGAALAVSILTTMKNYGSKVIATTHYQEVKMFAIQTEGVENACCEFDVNTLKPTYKLIIGVPGKSNAFAISSRLGMSDIVIDRARELVSKEDKKFEEVVEALEAARQELESLKHDVSAEKRKYDEMTAELDEKLVKFEQQKEKELEQMRQKSVSIVEDIRFKALEMMDELDDLRKEKDRAEFSSKVIAAKSQLTGKLNKMHDMANPVIEKKKEDYKLPRPLKPGDTVKLADINKVGSLIGKPDGFGNCLVQVGIIKMKTNKDNLRLVEDEKQQKKSGVVKKSITSNMERKGTMEIDIRGMSADEGIMEVDRFIDSSVLGGIKYITIIHGKGTGVLRSAVHSYLKSNKCVRTFRLGVYGEGESGVTVVELK